MSRESRNKTVNTTDPLPGPVVRMTKILYLAADETYYAGEFVRRLVQGQLSGKGG